MIKAKKSLSQNFIIDKNICKKIVKLSPIRNKIVLEIGPGKGFLTDIILDSNPRHLYAIEKDDTLCKELRIKYKNNTKITIINKDILEVDLSKFEDFYVFSNLPYNVGTKIILYLFQYSININSIVVMIQKEVADKFDYSLNKMNKYKFLTSLVSNYEKCFNVPPSVFKPKPKVNSTVVKYVIKKEITDLNKAIIFCDKIFKNKRKMIYNKFENFDFNKNKLSNKRVEQLNIEELSKLYYSF